MRFLTALSVFLVLCTGAHAARVELYDRMTGETLPTYTFKGRLYVAGEPGHEYEIRIHSDSPQRVLAVTSVDGVNVITGQTGAVNQSGYVLDPYGYTNIEGWRKSMTRAAAFYFTKLPDSYAARTGRPDNVGVIGVALFGERTPCCYSEEKMQREVAPSAQAPASGARRERADSADAFKKSESRAEQKLGTGHGRNEYSAAHYTEFQRASSSPDETITIYYDSERNLIAQGVLPSRPHYANRLPQPFPGSFVPDP